MVSKRGGPRPKRRADDARGGARTGAGRTPTAAVFLRRLEAAAVGVTGRVVGQWTTADLERLHELLQRISGVVRFELDGRWQAAADNEED